MDFFLQTTQFCQEGESLTHNRFIPTKQNALCETRDTWDVISENEDFVDATPMDAEAPPATEFEILGPQLGEFVMVLDRSGRCSDVTSVLFCEINQCSFAPQLLVWKTSLWGIAALTD